MNKTENYSQNSRLSSIIPPNSAEFSVNDCEYMYSNNLNNVTLNISKNYYGANDCSLMKPDMKSGVKNNKRSTEASIDKKSVKDLQNKVINIDEESRNKKHYTYSKENINKKFESKDQKFPDLKMPIERFNMYKYTGVQKKWHLCKKKTPVAKNMSPLKKVTHLI